MPQRYTPPKPKIKPKSRPQPVKQRAPATPLPGSSPITPPSGSAPRITPRQRPAPLPAPKQAGVPQPLHPYAKMALLRRGQMQLPQAPQQRPQTPPSRFPPPPPIPSGGSVMATPAPMQQRPQRAIPKVPRPPQAQYQYMPEEPNRIIAGLHRVGELGQQLLENAPLAMFPTQMEDRYSPDIQQAIEDRRNDLSLGDIGEMTINPFLNRLAEIPYNVNKPITEEEAQNIAPSLLPKVQREQVVGGVPGSYLGLGVSEDVSETRAKVAKAITGAEPGLGLRAKRGLGEIVMAPLQALAEPFMQMVARPIGAAMGISGKRRSEQASQLEAYITANNVPPDKADLYRKALGSEFSSAILPPDFKPQYSPVTFEETRDELLKGRQTYEEEMPLWAQIALPFFADPLIFYGKLAEAERLRAGAQQSFAHTMLPVQVDDVTTLFNENTVNKVLNKFTKTPLIGKAFARTPETRARLLTENFFSFVGGVGNRGKSTAERMEILGLLGKQARGDATWLDDAARYGLAPRQLSEAEAAAYGTKLGVQAGQTISPLESVSGKQAGLIASRLSKDKAVTSLLNRVEAGLVKGADDVAVATGQKAQQALFGRVLNVANELAGVQPGTNPIKLAQRAFSEYQGVMSRWFILNNYGRSVRDAMSSVTDAWANGVLTNVPREFAGEATTFVGKPVSLTRGVGGPGYENASTITSKFGQFVDQKMGLGKIKSALSKRGPIGEFGAAVLGGPSATAAWKENALAMMPYFRGRKWVRDTIMGGNVVPDGVVGALDAIDPSLSSSLEAAMKAGWSPKAIDRWEKLAVGGETFRVPPREFAEFTADHPELLKLIEQAETKEDLIAAFRSVEQEWMTTYGGLKPISMPDDTKFVDGIRQELINRGMQPGPQLEQVLAEEMSWRNANRAQMTEAQMWLKHLMGQVPEAEQTKWLDDYRRLELQIRQEEIALQQQVIANRLAGMQSGDMSFQFVNADLWREQYAKEAELYHTLREQIGATLPEELRIPDDIARTMTQPPAAVPPNQFAPTADPRRNAQILRDFAAKQEDFPIPTATKAGAPNDAQLLNALNHKKYRLAANLEDIPPFTRQELQAGLSPERLEQAEDILAYREAVKLSGELPPGVQARIDSETAFRASPEAAQAQLEAVREAQGAANVRIKDLNRYFTKTGDAKWPGGRENEQKWLEQVRELFRKNGVEVPADANRAYFEGLARSQIKNVAAEKALRQAAGPAPKITKPSFEAAPEAMSTPPDPAVAKRFTLPMEVRDLRRMREKMAMNWGNSYAGADTPEKLATIRDAASLARNRMSDMEIIGDSFGTVLRDTVYHNYGDQRNFDLALRMGYAYPYWYSREMAQWLRLYFENPHAWNAMQNLNDQVKEMNEDLPDWMQRNISVATNGGGLLSFPILNNLDPMARFRQDKFHDPTIAADELGGVYQTLNDFGPGATHSAWPMMLGFLASNQGKDDLAYAYASSPGLTSNLLQDATGIAPFESAMAGLGHRGYQMMFEETPDGRKYVGTRYDRNALIKTMNDMLADGSISSVEQMEEALILTNDPYNSARMNDPAYANAWAIFNAALERRRQEGLITDVDGLPFPGRDLAPWLLGPVGRVRTEQDVAVMQSQQAYDQLRDSLEGADPDSYREQMTTFWNDPANQDYSNYIFGRKSGLDRDTAYAWSVLGRMGRGRVDNAYLDAVNMNSDLMSEFYEGKGIPLDWSQAERDQFMSSVIALGASLALPDLPTQDEWSLASKRRKTMMGELESRFFSASPELEAMYENFKYGEGVDRPAYIEAHPELQPVLDFEAQFVMNDVAEGKKVLGAYYATDSTARTYLWSIFNEDHADVAPLYDRYLELVALGEIDPLAKDLASDFYKQNKAAFNTFKVERKQFRAGLDDSIAELLGDLPNPRLPKLREDSLATGGFAEGVEQALGEQQLAEIEPTLAESDAKTWAEQYLESHRVEAEAQADVEVKKNGYLTGDNRNTYETTLYEAVLRQANGDPGMAQAMFEATHPGGWQVYGPLDSPDELIAYAAGTGTGQLREKLLTDNGNEWTRALAFIRTLDPQTVAQLKRSIPDIEVVWQHAQGWNAGPSEEARADIVGVKVAFNLDGSMSITRLSNKKYYGEETGGGTSGRGYSGGVGGYTPRKGGGAGGDGIEEGPTPQPGYYIHEDGGISTVAEEVANYLNPVNYGNRGIGGRDVTRVIGDLQLDPLVRQLEDLMDQHYELRPERAGAFEAIQSYLVNGDEGALQSLPSDLQAMVRRVGQVSSQTTGVSPAYSPPKRRKGKKGKRELEDITASGRPFDWNKYYGGEGPSLPGKQRNARGGGRGGAGGEQQPPIEGAYPAPADVGAWTSFVQAMGKTPLLITHLSDYFDSDQFTRDAMLQRFPELAALIQRLKPDELARLEAAYFAWAGTRNRPQTGRRGRGRNVSLRVYRQRGEKSGL